MPPVPDPRRIRVGPVELACWDSGGAGAPVVLMHSAWGSGEHWAPQLRSLRTAGLRPVAWSRRGHHGSGTGPADPGELVSDLDALADALGLDSFHLVGTAHGGAGALDYALSRPERVRSLALVASLAGLSDPDWRAETARLVPPAWERLPVELRELSPAYRYDDPEGARAWSVLTARAVLARVEQRARVRPTRDDLARLGPPALFVAGAADPYLPPERMLALAQHVPGARTAVVPGAGHSPAWERPDAFDRAVLELVAAAGSGSC